jgi:large subunit ribosomal protein L27e
LKKVVGDSSLAKEARIDTRKELKKVFEEKYKNQTGKNEKKASGTQYFFKRLRF